MFLSVLLHIPFINIFLQFKEFKFSALVLSFYPCDAETEQGIFDEVLNGELDFVSDPWPNISESAKDLVTRMLVRDPKQRITAHEVLCKL